MRRKPFISFPALLGWAAALVLAPHAGAMTPAQLQQRLARAEKLTIIDVRSPALYARGHIPGAINVPASLCPLKKFPPIGKVVVCDAGLGAAEAGAAQTAAAELGRKPGISVEILEGGFAAWESAHALTTRGRGMKSEAFNYISYSDLKATKPDDVLLVDLRKRPASSPAAQGGSSDAAALTDLGLEFPGMRLAGSMADSMVPRPSGVAPLTVLIDSADGTAQAAARVLKAGGLRRYAILAGGETILARHGQRGLQRKGGGFNTTGQVPKPLRTPN
jgi:rhodanese-related sulfurtransferase